MKSTLPVGFLFVVDTGFKIFKNLFILFGWTILYIIFICMWMGGFLFVNVRERERKKKRKSQKLSKWGVMKLVGSEKLESEVDKWDVREIKKGE